MASITQQSISGSSSRSSQTYIVATAFLSLFALVGIAYYGLPFFYDFMTREYGWSRTIVISGNAVGKLLVGPLFGFIAGWMIDRYGPRRLMISGSLMMGVSLVGLSFSSSLPKQGKTVDCYVVLHTCSNPKCHGKILRLM